MPIGQCDPTVPYILIVFQTSLGKFGVKINIIIDQPRVPIGQCACVPTVPYILNSNPELTITDNSLKTQLEAAFQHGRVNNGMWNIYLDFYYITH